MIKKDIYLGDFIEEFKRYDRLEQFGIDGLEALYEYLVDLSEDLGHHIEMDVIGLSCDYTRYENLEEFRRDYNFDTDEIENIDDVYDYTTVIKINDKAFIIQDY